jgi:hypothetical protein
LADNWFRVPLNAIVLAILLVDMKSATVFAWCSVFLAAAFVLQSKLAALVLRAEDVDKSREASEEMQMHPGGADEDLLLPA